MTGNVELHRLTVDPETKRAMERAAGALGITVASWRKMVIAKALIDQLGPDWKRESAFQALAE